VRVLTRPETTKPPQSPETAGSTTASPPLHGNKPGKSGYVLTREDQRKATEAAARARTRAAALRKSIQHHDLTVTVPVPLQRVVEGLRDSAAKGNAPAAAQLLAYLRAYPTAIGGKAEDVTLMSLEDMTDEQLALAEAIYDRHVQRAAASLRPKGTLLSLASRARRRRGLPGLT
jgi:hypothetical protein